MNEFTQVANQLSLVELILHASPLVQGVMALLLLLSVLSWMLILRRSRVLYRAKKQADDFEEEFWKGRDLNGLYHRLSSLKKPPTGMSNIFATGYAEYAKLRRQPHILPESIVESCQRVMRVTLNRELDQLDRDLTTLATIGSVSPYIGLFGTVWGIMSSFHALGGMQQVTLAMVAPGISEALIATAMGLFAAIPAVMAYNHYADDLDRLTTRYDAFLDEFTGLLQRQAYARAAPAPNLTPAPVLDLDHNPEFGV
jgi:biopolymer transport protein TolQ